MTMLTAAAAFGRLCVETFYTGRWDTISFAAAFGRLCVETSPMPLSMLFIMAAAFGRLCVETLVAGKFFTSELCSRLRAAVC